MYVNRTIRRTEMIEVAIPQGATNVQYNFPDQPNLRNARIWNIEFVGSNAMSVSPMTGSAIIQENDVQACTINLYQGDLQVARYMPLNAFRTIVNSGTDTQYRFDQLEFDGLILSWTKCFLYFQAPVSQTNVVVPFMVTYSIVSNQELELILDNTRN